MNIEEFVYDYLQEHRHDVLLNPYNGLIDFANAFKEKMMKDAVEGEVVKDWDNNLSVKTETISGFKFGDKVRVIVLPKED